MLKIYQFKTQCKGDIHNSKSAKSVCLTCTSEVVFKLGDTSYFNQLPWIMHLNLNTILNTLGRSPIFCHDTWQNHKLYYGLPNEFFRVQMAVYPFISFPLQLVE